MSIVDKTSKLFRLIEKIEEIADTIYIQEERKMMSVMKMEIYKERRE